MRQVRQFDPALSDRARNLVHVAIVCAIAGVPIVTSLFNLATPFVRYGSFGFYARTDGTITEVVASSAAADAGLKPADRFDVAALSPQERIYLNWPLTMAGRSGTFALSKGPAPSVTLVARGSTSGAFATGSYFAVLDLLALAVIAMALVAAILALNHSSRTTWAFLIYAAGAQAGSPILTALLPPAWVVAYSAYCGVLWFAASAALVVFALRFPSDRVRGAGAVADRWIPAAAIVIAAPIVAANAGLVYAGLDTGAFELFLTIASTALCALAAIVFGVRYATEGRDERPRMAWVVASFIVGYAGMIVARILDGLGVDVPTNVFNFLLALNVAVPVAVAYAIVKQRVISVRFFVNKALVFAVLVGIAISGIVLLDWFLAHVLEGMFARAGGAVVGAINLVAALVLGFLMPWLYTAIRNGVDRCFFPQQYRARREMTQLAEGLAQADSTQIIRDALVRSVAGSLEIGSVAVFVRSDDGTFRREAAEGWGDGDALGRLDTERLSAAFEAARGPVDFGGLRLAGSHLPTGDAAPAVGLPIFVEGKLSRFVLYSGHPYGLDLDPSEKRLIGDVTQAASHGFARLSQL